MAGVGGSDGPGTWGPDEKKAAAKQRIRTWKVMCDWQWHTLEEISLITLDPEPSVSARLRDFRKRKHGGHTVLRERLPHSRLYQYRIEQPADSHDPA